MDRRSTVSERTRYSVKCAGRGPFYFVYLPAKDGDSRVGPTECRRMVWLKLWLRHTYGDMERLSSSSSSTAVGGEGEVIEGVDRWIVKTGVDPRIPPIPGLDHPNILSNVDVLR